MRYLVASLILCASSVCDARLPRLGYLWENWCGRTVATQGSADALIQALQSPRALRDRLFRDAVAAKHDLSQVAFPEARPQLEWMRTALASRLGDLTGRLFWRRGASRHRLVLANAIDRLDAALARPVPDYRETVSLAGLFASVYHLDRSYPVSRTMTLGSALLADIPIESSDFPFPFLLEPEGPPILSVGARDFSSGAAAGPELSEYVLVPLAQSQIHSFVEGDLFLRLWSHRIYPLGLTDRYANVHDEDESAFGFAHHDLLHARLGYRAWKRMQSLAHSQTAPQVLSDWYRSHYQNTERIMEDYLEAKNQISDPALRDSVGVLGWELFHETRIAINPLEAFHLLHFARRRLGLARLYTVRELADLKKLYGRFYTDSAYDWHSKYWESQLPAQPETRAALLSAHEATLYAEGLIARPGEVRYGRRP
jgi:hypothetical protein